MSGGIWGGWFSDLSRFHLLRVLWNQDRGGNIPISREMGTGLLGLLRVQVCTVSRLLLLGQSISALK